MDAAPSRPSQSWWWKRHFAVSTGLTVALLLFMLWTSVSPELSREGERLLGRGALLVVLILATAVMRTFIGRHPKRSFGMLMGTLGGMAAGIAAAAPLSRQLGTDVSTLSALAGVFLGWAVAYQFVKHVPRSAN